MSLLDITILIIITLTTVRGIFRGIIQEAATILGIIASFFLASYYYKNLAFWSARFIPNHTIVVEIFCFVCIFFLCLFLFHLLALVTRGATRLALLGWLDRILGGLFGLLKGSIITFFLVTLLMLFHPKSSPVVKDSRFFPSVLKVTERVMFLIPDKIKEDFLNKKRDLEDIWKGKKQSIQKMKKLTTDE
jgi:membrane protein required for colicin V production